MEFQEQINVARRGFRVLGAGLPTPPKPTTEGLLFSVLLLSFTRAEISIRRDASSPGGHESPVPAATRFRAGMDAADRIG